MHGTEDKGGHAREGTASPYADERAKAAWARELGNSLGRASWNWLTISRWCKALASAGLKYWDRPLPFSDPSSGILVGNGYSIAYDDATREGWRLRAPPHDVSNMAWQGRRNLLTDLYDEQGVFLSAHEPDVVCVRPNGWSRSLPSSEQLPGTILAVAIGNGRLVIVSISPSWKTTIYPFAFESQLAEAPRDRFPYVDRDAFAAKLRLIGRSLAESAEDLTAQAFDRYTTELGFELQPRPATSHDPIKGITLPAATLGKGWELAEGDMTPEGWRIRNRHIHSDEGWDPIDAGGVLIAGHAPSVTVLMPDRWSSELPPAEDLSGCTLLIVPGNGYLVCIEMGDQGLVTLYPFP
jgi:hypothetical protein